MKLPLISDYIRYFKIYVAYVGKRFYGFLVLVLLVAASDALGITMLLPLLKASQVGEDALGGKAQFLYDFLAFLGVPLEIGGILLFIGVIFLLKGLLKFSQGAVKAALSASLSRQLKKNLFGYYAGLDYQYFIKNNTGHYVNVLNGQVNLFIRSFNMFSLFSAGIITTAVYLGIALYLNAGFTAMALGAAGILLFFLKYVSRYSKKLSIKTSQENSNLNKFLVQTLHAMKYLQATGRFKHLSKNIKKSIDKLAGLRFRLLTANAFVKAVREPFVIFVIIGVVVIQVEWLNQAIAPIIVTLLLFYRSMNQLIGVQNQWQQLMNTVGGVEMVLDEFDRVQANQEVSGVTQPARLQEGLKLENVSYAYHDKPVLKDLNITIPKNKTVAFVGESGAGKSTLTDLLSLVLKPQQGDIYIDGVSSKELDYKAWRQKIGFVPQDTVVFDDTVANNISLWTCDFKKDQACQEKVKEVARKAHCEQFVMEMPKGFQTPIGDRGVRVSGGQRQRLSIARELFKDPELLILDEATSALDTESEQEIQESIDELKGKMTVVIIAHRLSTIKNVDYIYVLDQGEVIEEGSYEQLVAEKGSKFKEMTEMQKL